MVSCASDRSNGKYRLRFSSFVENVQGDDMHIRIGPNGVPVQSMALIICIRQMTGSEASPSRCIGRLRGRQEAEPAEACVPIPSG